MLPIRRPMRRRVRPMPTIKATSVAINANANERVIIACTSATGRTRSRSLVISMTATGRTVKVPAVPPLEDAVACLA